jgi:hypothetical protein
MSTDTPSVRSNGMVMILVKVMATVIMVMQTAVETASQRLNSVHGTTAFRMQLGNVSETQNDLVRYLYDHFT